MLCVSLRVFLWFLTTVSFFFCLAHRTCYASVGPLLPNNRRVWGILTFRCSSLFSWSKSSYLFFFSGFLHRFSSKRNGQALGTSFNRYSSKIAKHLRVFREGPQAVNRWHENLGNRSLFFATETKFMAFSETKNGKKRWCYLSASVSDLCTYLFWVFALTIREHGLRIVCLTRDSVERTK